MLYKFKSKATGDLIMLEPNGRQVLEIIGKDPGPKGIILPEQMPAALSALDAALAKAQQPQQPQEEGKDEDDAKAVSLRQRIAPFADMLRRASAEKAEVVWGV